MKSPQPHLSTNQVLLAAALFLTAFANLAFFRNLAAAFAETPWGLLHMLSLAVVLMCATVLLLALVSFRPVLKPVLFTLFGVASLSAYFMDTYNVIIDRDMLVNAMATNPAESGDLLTPRLFLYLGLLGLLPSLVLWRVRIRPARPHQALGSRLLLGGGALVVMLALVLISSAFYAAFVREHKELRYYANPLTPLYSAYKFGKTRLQGRTVEVQAIGEDAEIPATDIDRELVIMVLGETARADRFSLNGYARETNPELARHGVISFTDVSACGTSTAISVPCMFDIYDRDEFSADKTEATENALDVLNHAGVSILWRDNNSDSKGVADRLAFQDFRSPELNPVCDEECRDVGMLSGLSDFIDQQEDGDILIVLHQMGSHGPAYFKRYPQEFRVFAPTCESNQLDSCSESEIANTYDNTILYTDHFLGRAIELLRGYDDRFETVMLYASDHGESLGESGVYLHGLPYWLAPDAQTHVPVILWFGRNYHDVDVDAMRQLADEPLSHDNLFHTLLGLFELDTGVYDGSMDLLQKSRDLAAGRAAY
ncbi:MAG TPA: phosphoethanolamine--lipid A transferase [Xanthomonadales bacterium]|nr:phosphoethanolamine--lipid A transferase [Xanthomonadales bacterium]